MLTYFIFILLQVSNVVGIIRFKGFTAERLRYVRSWIYDQTFPELRYAISLIETARESPGAVRDRVHAALLPLVAEDEIIEIEKVFKGILNLDTDLTVCVTVYGNEAHHVFHDGQRYDNDFFGYLVDSTPISQPVPIDPIPLNIRMSDHFSWTVPGLNLVDEGGIDMSSMVHVSFHQRFYTATRRTADRRTFSEIREQGLIYSNCDCIISFSCTIVHEFAHAFSMLRERTLQHRIQDGQKVLPPGIYAWDQVNRARRGEIRDGDGPFSPLNAAFTYETAFKLLCLSMIRGRDVGWQFGKVDPHTLLSVGPDNQLYDFGGHDLGHREKGLKDGR